MCGIIVSTSSDTDVLNDHKTLLKRGPDQHEIIHLKNASFSFHRLAIMDLHPTGMQPFINKDFALVANAEIFNFKALKKDFSFYKFTGTSDCEVLIPMYEKYGIDMFHYLDAEFAIVLYNKKTNNVLAGKDPIGIRPLFYGYAKIDGKIVFASEAKAIINYVRKVYPFPPGHVYKDGEFIKYYALNSINTYYTNIEYILGNIKKKLVTSVKKRLQSDAKLGFLLSGGLDSSLVCAIAQTHLDYPIKTFSIGMEHDPIDLKYAKQVADYLGTSHTEVTITKKNVLDSLKKVIYALESFDITTIRASVGMYLISKFIHENTDIKVLLTGEVSDELFGYKYTDYAPNKEEFQKESIKRVKEIYMYDVLRADRCLAANSLEARVPFADKDFVSFVLQIDPMLKMNTYNKGKYLLRKAFEGDYLPKNILYREKAAFSDAVGHSLVDYLKEFAEKKYTDAYFNEVKNNFNPVPLSKEALLYREIFDDFYPNHHHLIKDYWMPNNEWQGCNVDDPSARVLSNYGASAK
ncbi:MAG: asparagine synthase B [Candidatus Izimaplasma sp.]|nr:asparagine synthase B [Candidatus Izimaplasma bacterium]